MSQIESSRSTSAETLGDSSNARQKEQELANARGKTVLVVAYHFPPASGQGLPGTQRAIKLTRYLPDFGWTPVVLTVSEKRYPDYIHRDEQILAQLPPELSVNRTTVFRFLQPILKLKSKFVRAARQRKARTNNGGQPRHTGIQENRPAGKKRSRLRPLKDFVTDLFEIPDEVAGWIVPAVFRGRALIRQHSVDAIFATGRPWTSLVIGGLLSRLTGVPLVTDFRDPWMTNPFRSTHSGFKNSMDARLERFVVRQSRLIVANTEHLRQEFTDRYPSLAEDGCVCIPNGYDELDLQIHRSRKVTEGTDQQFTLVHAGFLYGRRDPKLLIDAIANLLDGGKLSKEVYRVCLIGPRELPYDLDAYIRGKDLHEFIECIDTVPYQTSLEMVARSSAAIVLQPDTMTQVPSKLFENIGLGKQTLAIAKAGSATEKLFSEHRLGFFADSADVRAIESAISSAYDAWRENGKRLELSADVIAKFNIRTRIEEIANHLHRLAKK